MHKTLLIFRHEFLKTVRKAGFIIFTLALPALILLALGVYRMAASSAKPAQEIKVGYVDEMGGLDAFTTQGYVMLLRYGTSAGATKALVEKEVTEFFVIPADFISSGALNVYTTSKEVSPPVPVSNAVRNFICSNLLAQKVPDEIIARVEAPVNMVMTYLTPDGEVAPKQINVVGFIVPGLFGFLLALSLMFDSTYVVQSLDEEKEHRIMEVLLTSVSTRQLLAGKVLGLGAAGLVQVVVWVATLPLLLALAWATIGGVLVIPPVPGYFWALGVVYFILGYAMFTVLSAAAAAVSSTVQEASSMAVLYHLFNLVPLWFISLLMMFPDSPVWTILTIFPFTAPVLTIMRLGLTGVPAWQLATNMTLLIVLVVGGLLLDAKILRAYMLMYGKRPGFRQIARSLRSQ